MATFCRVGEYYAGLNSVTYALILYVPCPLRIKEFFNHFILPEIKYLFKKWIK